MARRQHRGTVTMIRFGLILATLLVLGASGNARAASSPPCPGMSPANTSLTGFTAAARPVVLVHGWDGGPRSMQPIGSALEGGLSVKTFYFDYQAHNTDWASRPTVASCLATYVDAVAAGYERAGGDGRVVVVAHSMGGLATAFSTSTQFAATPDTDALAGVVTIDTPWLGSPFGNTAAARGLEATLGGHPTSLRPQPQPGSDASICLAAHTPPGNALPSGCDLAPYLPSTIPLTQLAGNIDVNRTLFGVHLYTVPLSTDGIVPVDSAHGYLTGGPGGRAPHGTVLTSPTVTCTVNFDQVAAIASAQARAGSGGSTLALSAGLLDVLSPTIFSDASALSDQLEGSMGRQLLAFLADAYLAAPCSHSRILTSPGAQQDVIDAVARYGGVPKPDAAPPAGDTLTTLDDSGRVSVIADRYGGFSVLDSVEDGGQDESTLDTYDASGSQLASIDAGELTGECGAADIYVPGRGRLVVAELDSIRPAEGIQDQQVTRELRAWNAESGAPVWRTKVAQYEGDPPDCYSEDTPVPLQGFGATADGRYATFDNRTVALLNGTIVQDGGASGAAGNYFVDVDDNEGKARLIAPASASAEGLIDHIDASSSSVLHDSVVPMGMFTTDTDGESPSAGMSSDGGRLFVTPDSDRTTLAAYSLPNPTPLWTSKARDMYLIGDGGGTLLTQQADANGSDRLVGLDDRTGTQLWSIDTGQVCAVSNSQALLSANGEFATIDIKTGKQTDVEPPSEDEDAECPVVYAGGIGLDSDGHAVKQWIAP